MERRYRSETPVAAGKLTIPIARRMPLTQIRAAHALAEHGAGGKIVLVIE
jgi:NADPH:quinone reductase-like Zn-dependent oxidoreductase